MTPRRSTRPAVRIAFFSLLAVVTLLAIEAVSAIGVTLVDRAAPYLIYRDPHVSAADYARYLRIRDPILGWPSSETLSARIEHDVSGARPSPAFPEVGGECISLYGDSFSYGDEVSDDAAWSNQLALAANCRVANFGVGGYGTDQALLRFEQQASDHAPWTLLGIFPDNILRNVNQYRYLLSMGDPLSFKPRFLLSDGELILHEIPTIPDTMFHEFSVSPEQFLQHESFLPDQTAGPVRRRSLRSLTILSILRNPRVRSRITREPSWASFAMPEHPSGSFDIARAIVRRFVRGCNDRQKQCVVILFPSRTSYANAQRTGASVLQPLADAFEASGVDAYDLTRDLSLELGERDVCTVLTRECAGHLNEEGSRIVALLVHRYLKSLGFTHAKSPHSSSSAQ